MTTSTRRLEIRVDQTGDAEKGIKGIAGSVGKIAKVGLAAGAAAVGGVGLLAGAALGVGKKLSNLGANAEEMKAKFDAVFGKSAPAAAKELDEFGNVVGRNKFALMGMAAEVQDTFVPLGFARDKAADMSVELVKLASDVGSFNNVLAPDVLEDFQAALVGETETVRKYGIVINEGRIKTKAMEMGLIKMHVSASDVEEATRKVEIAQAKYNETMGGSTVDTEKVKTAQIKLGLATDKASVATRKHASVLEEHGKGSIEAQASAIRLASANERVRQAHIKVTEAMAGGEVTDSKKLIVSEKLLKAEGKLESALVGEAEAMTETAKASAIMQIIIENTSDAHGDAERTSGSWTNQMLTLTESVTEGATEMGLFLNESLLPLLVEFTPWIKDLMPKAVEVFKKFAESLGEVVGPALIVIKDAVVRVAEAFGGQAEDISAADTVLWIFEKALGAIITAIELVAIAFNVMADAVEFAVELWGNLKPILSAAWDTLKKIAGISFDKLVGWWDKMKGAARKAIDAIPDWLKPGSPTPFEIGLRGIGRVAKDLDLRMGMGKMGKMEKAPMTGAGKGGGTVVNINLTYSPAISLADRYEVQEKLTPFILGALRTAGVTL